MGIVRTILGDIDSEQMGFTLPHEHLLTRPVDAVLKTADEILMMDSVEAAVKILQDFKDAGGNTFVEMTPRTHGRNTPGMVRASREVGAHVIATTGFICQKLGIPANIDYIPFNKLVDEMVEDIMVGMDGTEHKAGVVKAGTSYMRITPGEEKVFRAGVRAAIETGAPFHTHTDCGTMGLEQIELARSEGLDPERMTLAHVDRNPDLWYHRKMLNQGVSLIYDGPGKAKYYPDSVRVELLRQLVSDGFERKLMLSNDIGKRSYHPAYGGGPGHRWLICTFLPRLLDEGFSSETIQNFMIHNPATVYSLAK
jgi:phosphotriesterase-related protein